MASFSGEKLLGLLCPQLNVSRVELEKNSAGAFDDIAVYYYPEISAGAESIIADFYQVKYHVDNRDVYCSKAMIDPEFANTNESFLKRFYTSYEKLRETHNDAFRLNLVSNWQWRNDDPLASCLRLFEHVSAAFGDETHLFGSTIFFRFNTDTGSCAGTSCVRSIRRKATVTISLQLVSAALHIISCEENLPVTTNNRV